MQDRSAPPRGAFVAHPSVTIRRFFSGVAFFFPSSIPLRGFFHHSLQSSKNIITFTLIITGILLHIMYYNSYKIQLMHIDYKLIVFYRYYSSLHKIRSGGIFAKNFSNEDRKTIKKQYRQCSVE